MATTATPINIVAGNDLPYHFLYGSLPDYVLVALDRELSYMPVGYDRTDAYQRGEWDGRVRLLKQSRGGKSWYFASGLLSRVTGVLDVFGVQYTVQKAQPREFDPQGFEWVSPLTLRSYQQEVVDKVYSAGGGLISLPTGGGKTVIGLRLVQKFDVPTLIVCHTRELLYQWRDEIKLHLGVDAGLVGDGERDFQPITVAMLQTLGSMIRARELDRLEYGMLLVDECLPYNTPVVTDIGEIPIGEIVEKRLPVKVLTHTGKFRRVVGYQKIPLIKRLVRVIHEHGVTVCTEDHKILTRRGWIEAWKLTTEDVIFHVCEKRCVCVQGVWEGVCVDDVARRSCVCGAFNCESGGVVEGVKENVGRTDSRGAGCCSGEVSRDAEQVAIRRRTYGGAEAVDTWGADGRYEHSVPKFEEFVPSAHYQSIGCTRRVLDVEVLDTKESYKIASSRGCESRVLCRKDNDSRSDDVTAVFHADIQSCEGGKKDVTVERVVGRNRSSDSPCDVVSGRRFSDRGEEQEVSEGVRAFDINCIGISAERTGERAIGVDGSDVGCTGEDKLEFEVGKPEPICNRSYKQGCRCGRIPGDSSTICSSVHGLQSDERLYVYDITVEEDHSFFANRVCHRNCHRIAADMAYNIAMRCTARIRIGLSATPKRTDNADLKIFAATGPVVANLTPCDLVRAGYLARPKLTLISVGGSPGFFSQDWQKEYVAQIVTNDERNERIVDEVVRLVREGKQTYIHVERVAHMNLLYNMIAREIGEDKVARIWGKISTKTRQQLLKQFQNCDINVLIGTILKEGVNLPAMDAVVLAGGLSSPIALVQKVGRVLRRNERFDYAEVIDFIDNCGRFCRKHSELRYQAFMEYYGDCIEIEMV